MYRSIIVVALVLSVGAFSVAQAGTFSIGADISELTGADILTAGPSLHVPAANLGLTAGDNLNALSSGLDTGSVIYFSVAGSSDIRVTTNASGLLVPPTGFNTTLYKGSQLGLSDQDDLDAFNFDEFDLGGFGGVGDGIPDRNVYYGLAAGSSSLDAGADETNYDSKSTADDIFINDPGTVYAHGGTMGLEFGDDLDGLVLFDFQDHGELTIVGDQALFSLAEGSPTLSKGIDLFGNEISAADIFYTNFDGSFSIFATASELGLDATFDVDAIEVQPSTIPEPFSICLLGAGLVGLIIRRYSR